jgi:Raf kinase inhibitor-like YbhB/YbcL family protein
MHTQRFIGCLVIAAVGLASCGSTSSTSALRTTIAVASSTNASPATTLVLPRPSATVKGIALTLPWSDGGVIDKKFTCDGGGNIPDVTWTGVPPEAKELALVFLDDDATFLHWAPVGLPPSTSGIVAGATPPNTKFYKNGDGTYEYVGPCPGRGQKHTYIFTLYALPEPLGDLASFVSSSQFVRTLDDKAIAKVSVKGTYAQPA